MKKKILYVFLILGVFFTLLYSVGAETARAPQQIPSAGTHLYGTVDEPFDFSKISFKPSSGTENIVGKSNLRKIMLATTYTINSDNQIVLSDDWFTAYCLDQTVEYPEGGLMFAFNSHVTDYRVLFERALLGAILNEANVSREMYNLIGTLKGYIYSSVVFEVPEEYMDGETFKYQAMVDDLYKKSETRIKVQVKELNYAKTDGSTKQITGAQMNEAADKTGEAYEIELSRGNVLYNKYVTTNMGSSVNYNWALWIIEHSYPTLTLDRMYEDIGVSKDALEQEIVTLEGLSGDNKAEVNAYVENYVYATIQYAIWHVTGSKINGITIGNELIGSSELNKIFKYLILNREYSNYGSEGFKNEINVVKPSKEIYEESKETIKFGPYSISSKMISAGEIGLGTNDTEGVTIVDEDGIEITSVKEGEKFYIVVDQSKKIKEVEITAVTNDGRNFNPTSNRGRVYYAHDPLTQTLGTGGIIKKVSASTSFKITMKVEEENPKTGINSVATVFILSLIVFSLGYLLVSYKNRAIEL